MRLKGCFFAVCIVFIFYAGQTFAQVANPSDGQKDSNDRTDEKKSELEVKAVRLLFETGYEIGSLRTVENRISFSAEIAGLMWFHDPAQAKKMFRDQTSDFVRLLTDYGNALAAMGGIEGRKAAAAGGFTAEQRLKASRKFYKSLGVRRQIALSMAEHDAELAFEFVSSTAGVFNDESLTNVIAQRDGNLFAQIIQRMTVQDVGKARELGKKMLADGFSSGVLPLLRKIHAKDEKEGLEFAREVLSAATASLAGSDKNLSEFTQLLAFAKRDLDSVAAGAAREPLFRRDRIRPFVSLLAKKVLERKSMGRYQANRMARLVAPFSEELAGRIRAKFRVGGSGAGAGSGSGRSGPGAVLVQGDGPPPPPPPAPRDGFSTQAPPKKSAEPGAESFRELQNRKGKALSDEEKEQVVERTRSIIYSIEGPDSKLAVIIGIATKVKQLGESDLASEIMEEANVFVSAQPRNYAEYARIWLLAGAYADVDPDKAFPILEDAIFRLNETIGAFVTVGEFIDLSGEIVEDGELQVGSFGGGMTKDLLGALASSDIVLYRLALSDFDRTAALADKFDRPEAKIMARMLILRSVLGGKKK